MRLSNWPGAHPNHTSAAVSRYVPENENAAMYVRDPNSTYGNFRVKRYSGTSENNTTAPTSACVLATSPTRAGGRRELVLSPSTQQLTEAPGREAEKK